MSRRVWLRTPRHPIPIKGWARTAGNQLEYARDFFHSYAGITEPSGTDGIMWIPIKPWTTFPVSHLDPCWQVLTDAIGGHCVLFSMKHVHDELWEFWMVSSLFCFFWHLTNNMSSNPYSHDWLGSLQKGGLGKNWVFQLPCVIPWDSSPFKRGENQQFELGHSAASLSWN